MPLTPFARSRRPVLALSALLLVASPLTSQLTLAAEVTVAAAPPSAANVAGSVTADDAASAVVSPVARSGDRSSEIRAWVRSLGHPDPSARGAARAALLGLRRSELTTLRDVVSAQRPLRPVQAEPLEEIVTYILTRATLSDLPTAPEAFLGVSLPRDFDVEPFQDPDQSPPSSATQPPGVPGVPIVGRLGGFVAYRYLEDGDVIETVRLGDTVRQTHTVEEFRAAIRHAKAGQNVTFRLRRAARVIEVTVPLDARRLVDAIELEQTIQQAQSNASDYWQQTFAPLVDDDSL